MDWFLYDNGLRHERVKNPIYYRKFVHIQTYSRHDIVTYLEPCVTLVYSEPCHIQNPGIFRTLSRHILAYSERHVTLAY